MESNSDRERKMLQATGDHQTDLELGLISFLSSFFRRDATGMVERLEHHRASFGECPLETHVIVESFTIIEIRWLSFAPSVTNHTNLVLNRVLIFFKARCSGVNTAL